MKYAFIHTQRHRHTVRRLCSVRQVSRSGYYASLTRMPSQRHRANQQLLTKIRVIHKQSRGNYGADKTWHVLRAQGETCGRHRVARLRQINGIEAKRKQRFRASSAAKNNQPAAPNILNRQFNVEQPDRVWVSDTTFIPTRKGWLYLAVILDLYSRRVVGWSMSDKNNQHLVIDALQMAIQQRSPCSGLLLHSDQGIQYACSAYRAVAKAHDMIQSMSRKGNCHDNAVAESFFNNLKNELVHQVTFDNREAAKAAIFDYMEIFYNRQRIHQTLGYQTPEQFEKMRCVA